MVFTTSTIPQLVVTEHRCGKCGDRLRYDIKYKTYNCGRCGFTAPADSFLRRRNARRRKKYIEECNRTKKNAQKKKEKNKNKRELF